MDPKLNLFPLYCLPPLNFLKAFANADKAQLALGEKFEKQTNRNRFAIAGPNGRQLLSLPLVHTSSHAAMCDVQLDYAQPWNIKHWRSIETAYNKAPFFEFYSHYFERLFSQHYFLLAEWNLEAMKCVTKSLKLSVELGLSTEKCQTLNCQFATSHSPYNQVFIEKNGFIANLSVLDLIFNEGPMAKDYL